MNDFPNLNIIYADSACMTLRPTCVIDAITSYYTTYPVCAGRSNHTLSVKLTKDLDSARKNIASFFGAKSSEIIFTKNTTEAINIVSHSLKPKSVILILDKEHNSNLVPWQMRTDCELRICPTTSTGYVDMDAYKKLVVGSTLVSFGLISNIDGVTQPAKELISLAHKAGAKVLIDGAQAAGHIDLDLHSLGCEYFACSSHKMMGPSLGMLYVAEKELKHLNSFITGGMTVSQTTHEKPTFFDTTARFEAGLQDYAGILGMSAACTYLRKIGLKKIQNHSIELNEYLTEKLKKYIGKKIHVLGPLSAKERGSIFNFYTDMPAHDVALFLDSFHVAVRSGQHCVHSYFTARKLPASVRISVHYYNTKDDVDKIVDAIEKVII